MLSNIQLLPLGQKQLDIPCYHFGTNEIFLNIRTVGTESGYKLATEGRVVKQRIAIIVFIVEITEYGLNPYRYSSLSNFYPTFYCWYPFVIRPFSYFLVIVVSVVLLH